MKESTTPFFSIAVLLVIIALLLVLPNYSFNKDVTHSIAKNSDKKVKAIIFDIGNVLVRVDLKRWSRAFKEKGVVLGEDPMSNPVLKKLVLTYGIGKLSTQEFIEKIILQTGAKPISNEAFQSAWNAGILEFDPEAVSTLKQLRSEGYRLFALSDTNEMHMNYIQEIYQKDHPNKRFCDLFDQCYLSHLTGVRKDLKQAWLQILKKENLTPDECLFVDDIEGNVNRAKALGMHIFHYKPSNRLEEIIAKVKALNDSQK